MRKQWRTIPVTIAIAVAMFVAIPAAARADEFLAKDEAAPIADSAIPPYITAAVNSPDRPAADKALDAGRKPAQMLAFFGIKPGMKVVDLSAGGGYTTELLSLVVGSDGKVYSQNPNLARFAKMLAAWHARIKKISNVVAIEKSPDDPNLLPVAPDSIDAAIINMNYHDLVHAGLKMDQMNKSIFRALKKGGVYGVIDNSAQAGSGARDAGTLHRIDEDYVVKQVEAAGFKLDAASSALRNPKDDRTWIIFKHRGEQDRFMLRFVKP